MELPIIEHEVRLAVAKDKAGCATRFNKLTVDVLRSNIARHCLLKLFNKCLTLVWHQIYEQGIFEIQPPRTTQKIEENH